MARSEPGSRDGCMRLWIVESGADRSFGGGTCKSWKSKQNYSLKVSVVAPFRMKLVMPSKRAVTLMHHEWITPLVNFNCATGQASDHWQSGVMGRPLANTQVHCTAPRASVTDRDDLTILPYKNMSCKLKTHVFFVGNWKFWQSFFLKPIWENISWHFPFWYLWRGTFQSRPVNCIFLHLHPTYPPNCFSFFFGGYVPWASREPGPEVLSAGHHCLAVSGWSTSMDDPRRKYGYPQLPPVPEGCPIGSYPPEV